MPRERKKRGRREAEKRRREEEEFAASSISYKRQKGDGSKDINILPKAYSEHDGENKIDSNAPFYGLLDEDEQEYFKRADSMLELNQFVNNEERDLFLANVYKEAKGKELKIANSQSCSRLLQRLILLSSSEQLKALFQTFSGQFLYLCQHRFASHCCETLFLQAAPIVNQELAQSTHQLDIQNGDVYVSMENLFLYTLNELEGNLGFLITDPFGSHVLRVLLLVLSGRPLKDSNTISLLRSRKKETVSTAAQTIVESTIDELPRTIPLSFQNAVDRIITKATADLDTRTVRALSNHPTGNPVLQLMLELELSTNGKAKAKEPGTIFYKLVPDQNIEEGSETCAFLRDLAYDTIGSRLLEVIIKFAAGKTFKSLYRVIFRDRLAMFAKNEIAGYVVSKLLERLGKEDLKQASEQLCSQMGLLVERSKTSIIRTLIDRCYVRETDTSQISAALQRAYGIDPAQRLLMMLNLNIDTREATANHPIELLESQNKAGVHGSLLAQSMLEKPGPLRELIDDALLAMNPNVLLIIAKDRVASRVLQTSLVCQDQPTKFRRILVQHFLGHIAELATDPISSHVIDAFWKGTMSMTFIRERIANELSEGESRLRESYFGRAVWKNWKMDLYKTRKRDWIAIARSGHKQSTTSMDFARARFTKAEKTDAKKSI